MFCSKCGKQLADGANFCTYCGEPSVAPSKPLGEANAPFSPTAEVVVSPKKDNVFALIGFVMSFFMVGVGLIFSIIGLVYAQKHNYDKRNFAIAGIIISAVSIAVTLLYVFVVYGSIVMLYVSMFLSAISGSGV